ncbi:hypothetical protein Golomagni_07841, partial [Golovinomyces magnicellulatus]
VIEQLQPQGYKCVAVTLPSTTGDSSLGFKEDVVAARDAIKAETSQGRNVVVIVHSYGGLVGVSAAKGFTVKSHDDTPTSEEAIGHVIGFCLIATGFAVTGMCMLDATGGKPPPQWIIDEEKGTANIVVDPIDMMYHDLSDDDGKVWAEKLEPQSIKALSTGGEYAYSAWQDAPVWYLVTVNDHALPAAAQQFFIKGAQDGGFDVTKKEIETSHSPMLGRPSETAAFIREAAEDMVSKAA